MILNQSQAQSVYSAMCALNNVSAHIGAVHFADITVKSCEPGNVAVQVFDKYLFVVNEEIYGSQTEFAAAYGLK